MTDPFLEPARQALSFFALKPVEVSLLALSENVTFKVVDGTGDLYALRLHRPAYHTLEELESEKLWTKALAEAGISLPETIATRDGRDYACAEIDLQGEVRWASLSRWVAGEPLITRIDENPDLQLNRLGALVATMNRQSSAWLPPAGFRRPTLDADGLMGPQPVWGRFWERGDLTASERLLLLETRDRLHGLLTRYGKDRSKFGVIHADLHPGNILVEDDRLTAIDFDDVAHGWYLYDLAVALYEFQKHGDFPALRDACLAGYRRVRPLSAEEVAMLPVFLLVRGMAEIGWLADRPENATASERAAMKDFVVAQCRDYLRGA